jgi:hypothetical protein
MYEQMIGIPMGTNRAGVRGREALGYTRLLLRLKIVLINLIFRIMYIVYVAYGGFRTCTAGYVVQQLSHSNYLKQRELF